MNTIWIVEKKIGNEVDYFIGAEDEKKGLQQALAEIMEEIVTNANNIWDVTVDSISNTAKEIHDESHSNDIFEMRCAMIKYNRFMSVAWQPAHVWKVLFTIVTPPKDILKLDDKFFGLQQVLQEEPSESKIKEDVKIVYACTGATCRKCKTFNEYAQPDCQQATYLCRQCNGFINIFSG